MLPVRLRERGGHLSDSTRRWIILAAGVVIILLAAASLLLPLAHDVRTRDLIGPLLLTAGLIELGAAIVRRGQRLGTAVAAGATVLAGLRLLVDPTANFFAVLNLIILWQIVRSAALLFASFRANGRMADWFRLASGTDFLLAVALLTGLPVALLVVGLFGPTPQVVATFAWIFAISFVATGGMLIATSRESVSAV